MVRKALLQSAMIRRKGKKNMKRAGASDMFTTSMLATVAYMRRSPSSFVCLIDLSHDTEIRTRRFELYILRFCREGLFIATGLFIASSGSVYSLSGSVYSLQPVYSQQVSVVCRAEETAIIKELLTMDADKVQMGVLDEILKRKGETEYSKRFGLEGKTDRLTFHEKVQVLMCKDLQWKIQRIANGDRSPISEFLSRKKENMVKGGGSEMFTISAMTGIVTIVAGYVTAPTGQKALDIATQQAWYLAPTNVFAFFMLASLFFAVMSKRFPRLEEYSAVCMAFASSSIARILLLQCPGCFAWIVYAPSAIVAFVFVIPDRVHRFLFSGVETIITRLMEWINGTSSIIASCAMTIHESFAGIRHEELPK